MPSKLKFATALTALFLLVGVAAIWSAVVTNQIFLARAKTTFFLSQHQYKTNSAAALTFGRACFHLAELVTNETERAEVAQLGIAACREAVARESNSAPAHFYLAGNLGELAQAEAPSLTAYRLVFEVEREFLKAAELDVHFDHAGPARTLGELYYKAPSWPLSVGSKHKAQEWFERAVELSPDYPGNQLNLAEAQLRWREREALEATLKNLDAIWPSARTNLIGEDWELAWLEWSTRRTNLKLEHERLYGPGH
jgi:tetratricopeptide (TPR) repeat protein